MDIVPASDPRVRVELTFHPEGQDPLTVSLPRWDFLSESTVRGIKSELRRFKQNAESEADEMRRSLRRYQVDMRRWEKAWNAWAKALDDDDADDPGPEPEEPARPEFDDPMDERDAERAVNLAMLKHVLAAAEFKAVQKCTSAEIAQARAEWDKASEMPLGELLASPTSSTETTEGPSEPTSSEVVGPSETSDTGSVGEISETS